MNVDISVCVCHSCQPLYNDKLHKTGLQAARMKHSGVYILNICFIGPVRYLYYGTNVSTRSVVVLTADKGAAVER